MIDVVCYYHEQQKNALLREAVLPAVAAARDANCAAHIERHWLHGPHVRVRLAGDRAEAVATLTADKLRTYVGARPSTAAVDPQQLLAESERAGAAELVVGPYLPIYPDNTVRVEPGGDRRIATLLGSAAADAGRTELLRLGVAPVAATVEQLHRSGNRTEDRVRLAIVAMAMHAANYPSGIGNGYHSFLSHLKDFLYYDDPDGRIAATFERAWTATRPAVTALVEAIVNDRSLPADLATTAASWRQWSRAAWQHAEATMETPVLGNVYGQHRATAARFGGRTEVRWDFSRREYSDYHALLNTVGFEHVARSRTFGIYRFCTNMLYQLLLVCDVQAMERYLAGYLFTTALDEVQGTTWRERLLELGTLMAARTASA